MTDSATMGDFLAAMNASSRKRVSLARAQLGDAEIQARALDTPAPPPLRLSARRFDLIAEVKFRSPAAGQLRAGSEEQVNARVAGYAEAGAAVVSVLTEPSHFDGSLSHLKTAVRALEGRIPAMRKDFLVDPYQVCEARLFGAGGVLLIMRMISDEEAAALIECAVRMRLFVVLESFDETDIVRAAALVKRYSSAAQLLSA
jgi:indole-3-glycerol phosphate synthase